MPFKKGDPVRYRWGGVDFTGVIHEREQGGINPTGWWVEQPTGQVVYVNEKLLELNTEEPSMTFKVGDRVKYLELDATYTGTITRSGEPRDTWWVCWDDGTDESLIRSNELDLLHTKFKVGDRVSMWIHDDAANYTGTVTRQHERNATKWWVRWDDDNKELWADENSLTLIPQSENQEQAPESSSHKFSVGELKALLSKMDDDIVISVTDFRISFKS